MTDSDSNEQRSMWDEIARKEHPMSETWDRKVPYSSSKESPYGNYSTPRRMQTLLTSELRGMGIELSDSDLEAVDWFAQTMSPTAIDKIVSWLGRVTQVREPLPDGDPEQ